LAWGVWAFADRLAEHETEPAFEGLLRRFLTEVFVWTYQIVGGFSVSRTLDLASRHEGCARLLFERLEAMEEERRSSMRRIDRERVENALRFGLSAQILNFTGRDGKTVPEASAALLGALSAFPLREVRSGPPPEWWERWRAAIKWTNERGEPVLDGWREARLMHPLYAQDEDLTGWRLHIFENGIVQPFEQASRAAYVPHEEELGLREVQRFETREVPGFDELPRRWNVDFRRPPYQAFGFKSYPEFGQRAFYSIQADLESPAADHAPAASVWFVPIAVGLWEIEEVRESALRIRDVHPMVFSETLRDVTSLFT
jgi:Domain of unknown function (DUF4132)